MACGLQPLATVHLDHIFCLSGTCFVYLQSDFDKNSKEVSPFQSAFTRQREIWAGRTASEALPPAVVSPALLQC